LTSANSTSLKANMFLKLKRMAPMSLHISLQRLGSVAVLSLLALGVGRADTLKQVTSAASQGSNDSLSWTQKGADGTILPASFTANTAAANAVTVSLGAANSVVSVVCSASPCSWTGTGFTAGHSLLWTSDAGNGGSGPVTLIFTKSVAAVGALIQADLPGAFTAQIQLFNGATALGSFTVASDTAGDPVYLGAIDQTAANITKATFSLTACTTLCTDFGLDTVAVNTAVASVPAVTLTPTSLTFASTNVGATTAAQVVTVKNSGTAALTLTSETITGTNASSFIKSATTCGASLAVGASCTVSVAFKPAAAGSLTAALSIADNATGSPQKVALSGTGTNPSLTVSLTPTTLTFASTPAGSTTAAQLVTIKNTSTSAVTLTSETITGTNATSFIKSATTCSTSLAAAASCTVSVQFKPATTGSLTASLSIADNATGSPQTVALTGTGAPALTVTLTPTSLAFAATPVGSTTAAQLVTIKNTSTSAVTLTSETITGTNATSFIKSATTCTTSLAAAASCTVSVQFKPAAAGSLTASLSIADNATGSPQAVALTGTGTATLSVTLTPTSIAFPTTVIGATSNAVVVTVKNAGTITVTISSIAVGGTNATSFLELNNCPASLAASATCSLYIAFKPTVAGALTGAVSVTDTATGSPQKVTLTGTGSAAPSLKLSVVSIAFPTTKSGSTSAAQTVTLTNSGTVTVTLTSIALTGTNPGSFEELNTCTSTLAPSTSCAVYVAFKPTAVGAASAKLTITDNGAASPQSVTLTGTGN
jgi:hypothetical protein